MVQRREGANGMNAKRSRPMRVGLYVRTSTANGQTTHNQERELQAVAERHGWEVVAVYRDQGISGSKGRDKRPGLDRLLQAVARRDIDIGRRLVGRSSGSVVNRPGGCVAGVACQKRRPLSAPAGARHFDS